MGDAWLDEELEAGDAAMMSTQESKTLPRVIVFSHIPPFVFHPEEHNAYFNLDLDLRQQWLSKMAARGVVAWFSGHYHRNAGGMYRDAQGRELEVVVTSAVGTQIVNKPG